MPNIEDANWYPEHSKKIPSQSVDYIRNLKVGDCKRIIHGDVSCTIKNCSLSKVIEKLRYDRGWGLEYYHEKANVMVIRRTR